MSEETLEELAQETAVGTSLDVEWADENKPLITEVMADVLELPPERIKLDVVPLAVETGGDTAGDAPTGGDTPTEGDTRRLLRMPRADREPILMSHEEANDIEPLQAGIKKKKDNNDYIYIYTHIKENEIIKHT